MVKNRYSKLFFGPLARKLLVKPCRMRKSCCKGFRRSPDAWKTLLALRRSSWQSSGPSCVQTLLRPRRRISHGRDGFGQETNLERTRFAWRVFRAVMASGALPKPGKRCFRRGGATGKPKRGGGRARQRNWILHILRGLRLRTLQKPHILRRFRLQTPQIVLILRSFRLQTLQNLVSRFRPFKNFVF